MLETREKIEHHLRNFAAFWDVTRASQDIAPELGLSGVRIFASTPQSMQGARTSREKARAMSELIEAFGLVKMTRPFRSALIGAISSAYDVGLDSNYVLAGLSVDLKQGDLGVFEQNRMQENEGVYLATTIKGDSLHFIGRLGFIIPEGVEGQMTHLNSAEVVHNLFNHPQYGWAGRKNVEQGIDMLYKGRFQQIQNDCLIPLALSLDWADTYGLTYRDDTFSKTADLLRPVVRIYLMGEQPGQRDPSFLAKKS